MDDKKYTSDTEETKQDLSEELKEDIFEDKDDDSEQEQDEVLQCRDCIYNKEQCIT